MCSRDMQSTQATTRPYFLSPRQALRCKYLCSSAVQEIVIAHEESAPSGPVSASMGNKMQAPAKIDEKKEIERSLFGRTLSAAAIDSLSMESNSLDWIHTDKDNVQPSPTDEYSEFWSEDLQAARHDATMMTDFDASSAPTQPATSCTSTSSPPPSIQQPTAGQCVAEQHTAERVPLHTVAVEAGGLDMAQLKDAMTKESEAQEPLVQIIGMLLDKTVARNDSLKRVSQLHAFESDCVCALPASVYLQRMMRYGKCSPSCAVVGLIYLQRIKTKIPSACVTSCNLQRLLLVSMLLANKFLDDLYYSNKHWAKIGGISLQEMSALELMVLGLLEWKMTVTREQYLAYLEELGCGPRNDASDTESWARDLHELKALVATGAGIRLYSDTHGPSSPETFRTATVAPIRLPRLVVANTWTMSAQNFGSDAMEVVGWNSKEGCVPAESREGAKALR